MKRLSFLVVPVLFALDPFLLVAGLFALPCMYPSAAGIVVAAVLLAPVAFSAAYGIAFLVRPEQMKGWYRPRLRSLLPFAVCWIAGFAALTFLLQAGTRAVNANYYKLFGEHIVRFALIVHPLETEENLLASAALADPSGTSTPRPSPPPPLWPGPEDFRTANDFFAALLEDSRFSRDFPSAAPWLFSETAATTPSNAGGRAGGACRWNCLAGAADCESDETPVLWSANLAGVTERDFAGADPSRPCPWRDRIIPDRLPGIGSRVVVIRKNGMGAVFSPDDLTDAAFLGSSSNAPARIQVLPAVP